MISTTHENNNVTPYNSTFGKDMRGNWRAKTYFKLPVLDDKGVASFELHICTSKVSSGKLLTTAVVHKVENGFFMYASSHFYKVASESSIRVTEKAVKNQHEAVIRNLETLQALMADAIKHHTKKKFATA